MARGHLGSKQAGWGNWMRRPARWIRPMKQLAAAESLQGPLAGLLYNTQTNDEPNKRLFPTLNQDIFFESHQEQKQWPCWLQASGGHRPGTWGNRSEFLGCVVTDRPPASPTFPSNPHRGHAPCNSPSSQFPHLSVTLRVESFPNQSFVRACK